MKHIKSFFLKLKAKKTLKTYQKPLLVTLLTLLFINIIVLLVGATVGMILDRQYYDGKFFGGTFMAAFVGSVKWMISPNSLTQFDIREEWIMMTLAIVIVIVGIVLFSGAIVATMTTALRAYIDTKSHAKGKILIDNHFVILNWNSKVPDMIYNLMLKGFKHNIVILSEKSKEYVESEIKSLFLTNNIRQKYKANLIIKEGDALLRNNLEDISIEQASQIVVMAGENIVDVDEDNIINADLLNLKIVLRLGSFKIREDCQIVVETDSDETRGQIENLSYTVSSLKRLNIIPVSFNKKIGQIIAQSLVAPRMGDLYDELFSFRGAEFYSIDSEQDIESYMKSHSDSIPVYKDHQLFVLADDEIDITKQRKNEYTCDKKFIPVTKEVVTKDAIFIIGDNSKKEFLLENLKRSKEVGGMDFSLKHYSKTDNEELIKDVRNTPGPKKILILSDDRVEAESYDANVFVSLIELSKAFPNKENITYITELLDSRNLSSISDFNIHNTIISNKMMSLLITQLAMNKGSKRFFEKVLAIAAAKKADDFDLVINEVDNMIEINEPMTFSSKAELLRTFYNTFDGKNILIGLVKNETIQLLNKNQDQKEDIVLNKNDSLIYIKYM